MIFGFKKAELKLPDGFTVTAHSGSEGTPDNSMEYLKKCVELDVKTAEIDVTFRKDGTPVIIHKQTAENDEGILFDEALKYISESSDHMNLNLDLKAFDKVDKVVDIIEKYALQNRCFFTGVGEEQAQSVKAQCRGIPYYLNASFSRRKKHSRAFISDIADIVNQNGAIGINCHYSLASKEMIKIFKEQGLLVSFWTANSESVMKRLLLLSPDNITTRFPVMLNKIIENR